MSPTTAPKKFKNMKEFMKDPQFKKFEKNSIAKLVQIIKEFDIYPEPTAADFAAGYEYARRDESTDGLNLKTVDLAPRQSVKLVEKLVLDNFGMIRLHDNGPDGGRNVQLVHYPGHWSYGHFGGGSNGCGLFSANFDLNGKLVSLRMEYRTRDLAQAEARLNNSEMGGTAEERALAKYHHKTARNNFMGRVERLIDQDNLILAAEKNQAPAQERC